MLIQDRDSDFSRTGPWDELKFDPPEKLTIYPPLKRCSRAPKGSRLFSFRGSRIFWYFFEKIQALSFWGSISQKLGVYIVYTVLTTAGFLKLLMMLQCAEQQRRNRKFNPLQNIPCSPSPDGQYMQKGHLSNAWTAVGTRTLFFRQQAGWF